MGRERAAVVAADTPWFRMLAADIEAARERIAGFVRETPLESSRALTTETGAHVLLKLENLQRTGSFKLRGATNKLLTLPGHERARGVVAASSGNHGAGVAWAADALDVPAEIFVPEGASAVKVDAMRRSGATVHTFGTDGLDTEVHARVYATTHHKTYISPYNDPAVIAGQGTVGTEIRRQAGAIDVVVVAVGGGGLIGGVAADLKAHFPAVRVVGVQPINSPVMSRSIRAGHLLEMESLRTLSDGTAGGIEADTITFELCRTLVDEWVEVPEDEIAAGMRHCIEVEHVLVEGAAGVAIAGWRRIAPQWRDARAAIVLCGANVSADRLRSVL
jgi:threonine dehydratase